MRTAGAVQLKKFLQMRLGDEDIKKAEQNQAKILGTPGATKGDEDPWEFLLREFVVNNTQLDLRGKELNNISPILWERYPNIQVLDLSQNPIQIPEEIGMLEGLKTLRLQQCGLKSLPMSVLKLQCLQSIDLDKNNFTEFYSSDLT